MRSPYLCPLFVAALAPIVRAQTTTPADPRRVLVVYQAGYPDQNRDGVGDSQECAKHFAAVRGVPAANLVGLKIAGTKRGYYGTSAWASFHDEIVTPVKAALAKLGATKIDTLLFCYGMPYTVSLPITTRRRRALDSLMQCPGALGTRTYCPIGTWFSANPYLEYSPSKAPDKGRFSHSLYRYGTHDMYLVNRVDGLDVDAAKDLVDGARYAELYGDRGAGKLSGTAYVDTRYGVKSDTYLKNGYPFGYTAYANADSCMAYGKFFGPTVGLTTKWEASAREIGETGAKFSDGTSALLAPTALLYGGWYNFRAYHDVWDWLPGSIACDLNSNSIQGFESPTALAFLSRAFPRGLSAGPGVVGEPYLNGHERPEVLLYYVVRGFTYAEAASLGEPALFWMGVHMGDPLYAPFAPGLKRGADTRAPPQPAISVTKRAGTAATLRFVLPRKAGAPELCRVSLDYGPTPKLGLVASTRRAYFTRNDLALGALADVPSFYARATLTDPAGNATKAPPFAFTSRAFTGVDVRVQALPARVAAGAPITFRLAVSAKANLLALRTFKVELGQGTRLVDVTQLAFMLGSELGLGPEFETLALAVHAPALLAKGTWTLRVTSSTATRSAQHAASFVVY